MVSFGNESQWEYDPSAPLGAPGGFGAVFRGRGRNGSDVAVKVVPPTGDVDQDRLRSREVEIMHKTNQLGSPRLIEMLDVAEGDAGELLIVLQLADGQLDIDPTGFPVEHSLTILEEIVAGLADLHAVGVIHRDLKPANILRTVNGLVLSDFGIARDAELGTQKPTFKTWGTFEYMAPELWRMGEPTTTSADLYAVGVIAHELLTGQRPFAGTTTELEAAHEHQAPPELPAHVPAKLRTIVTRLLAKDRHQRYPDARAVLEQLVKVRTTLTPTELQLAEAIARFDRHDAEGVAIEREAARRREHEWALFTQARADMAEIVEDAMARLADIDSRFELTGPVPADRLRQTSRDWDGDKHRWLIDGHHLRFIVRLWEPPRDGPSRPVAGEVRSGFDPDAVPIGNVIYNDTKLGMRWQLSRFAPNYSANRQISPNPDNPWQGLNEQSLHALWREHDQRVVAAQWVTADPEPFTEKTITDIINAAANAGPQIDPNSRSDNF